MIPFPVFVFFIRYFVLFLLMLETQLLCSVTVKIWRCMIGAVVGGIEGIVCLLPTMNSTEVPILRAAAVFLTCVIAFGYGKNRWKCWLVYVFLAASVRCTILISENLNLRYMLFFTLGSVLLQLLVLKNPTVSGKVVPMTITHNGRTVSLTALKDTGNVLNDPLTGERVFLISAEIASSLTGLSLQEIQAPMDTMLNRKTPGLRLIPFSAVGCKEGIMLGMRMQEVKLGKRKEKAIIGFAPEGLEECPFQALVTG